VPLLLGGVGARSLASCGELQTGCGRTSGGMLALVVYYTVFGQQILNRQWFAALPA